ncbi:MAG: outer membrane beta-barrel protein [Bacteroidales bacterium]|jgi:hypothetical protein|nr:outer membrane beta-barrel protein [Bacteroidales bacterium]
MKKFYIVVSFLIIASNINAQNKISGTVKNSPFASIKLVDARDTVEISNTFANDSGQYEFKRISKGSYFIQASAMGFHRKNSEVFNIVSASDKINVEDIELTPSSEFLDVVTVEAKRPLIELEAGKMTMNISESIIAKNDNVFEMLRKFPGVSIDFNDNISLNGKSGVLLTIDDRDPHLSGKDLAQYLRSMPGNTVQKIEAIDQPSAKYDAQGVSGIINIVTSKDNRNLGFSGSVNASLRVSERGKFSPNGGASINFQTKKAVYYGTFNYYHGNQLNSIEGMSIYPDKTRYLFNKNESEKWGQKVMHNYFFGKAGIDVYLTDKDVLSFSFNGSGGSGSGSGNLFTYIDDSSSLSIGKNIQKEMQTYGRYNYSANINYEHKFDTATNSKIIFDLSWTGGRQNNNINNAVSYFAFDTSNIAFNDIFYKTIQPIKSDIFGAKIDFEYPFKNKKSTLEAGIKGNFVTNNNYQEYILDNVRQDDNSYRYIYNELIAAAYIQFKHTFATKTSIEAGLRGEITYCKGSTVASNSNDTAFKKFYGAPFPSLTVSQEIDSKNKMSLSYRYRLTRPYFTQLNPFLFRDKENVYSQGNPLLLPEYAHSVKLEYSYGYFLNFSVSYSRTDGTPSEFVYYMPEHYAVSKPENAGTGDFIHLSFYTRQSFFKEKFTWSIYANGSYGVRRVNYLKEAYRTEGFSGFMWSQLEMDFGKDWSGEISYWGMFPEKNIFNSTRYMGSFDVGVKKMFLKKTLTVTLSANNIIPMNYKNSNTYPDGSYSSMTYRWDTFTVSLSVSYRFGNNKMTKGQRQVGGNDESSRMGGGAGSGGGGAGSGAGGGR